VEESDCNVHPVTPLIEISRTLSSNVSRLSFSSPITHVYNPLEYAREPHEIYLSRYGGTAKTILVGMNPGPFGMMQTGVPFGDVTCVRNFLNIEGKVKKPALEHPKRPIEGFACTRKEVSGTRLWGFAESQFQNAKAFFERFFVVNFCPLAFLEESGKNFTPDKLKSSEKQALFDACDEALRQTAQIQNASCVIGIGAFAEARAAHALKGTGIQIGTILHPSPASPAANRGWAEQVKKQLVALGVI
jgi:single-strand selective monofunctional uracil DNA glycosylase